MDIKNCEKLENITLPTTLINLSVEGCTELYRIEDIGDLTELRGVHIRGCPELAKLPSLSRMHCLEVIEIDSCGMLYFEELNLKDMQFLKRITLGREIKVEFLGLNSCQNLEKINFGYDYLIQLSIWDCPKLEELPVFKYAECLERVIIDGCGRFNCLRLDECQNLSSVSGNFEFKNLSINLCPELEELECLSSMSSLEVIDISYCTNVKSITLPTTLTSLSICDCGDLQRISATGDFMEISKKLTVRYCPVLEELPMFPMQSCTEEIEIEDCEKLQNITMPTTLTSLSIYNCRDLQRISATGDFMEISKELTISDCPVLEELPMFPMQSCIEEIETYESEKVENITLVEELRVLRWIRLSYCSKALTQNCIHKLKTLPLEGMYMSARTVDGEESSLNESLFSENNISVETVMEIGSHEWSDLSEGAIIVCFVVVVESFADVFDINRTLLFYYGKYSVVHEGESIITWVYTRNYWEGPEIVETEDFLKEKCNDCKSCLRKKCNDCKSWLVQF